MIQGILLAAGRSTRFGGNKLLHPLADGTPMAIAAARHLAAALPGALAVVSADQALLGECLRGEGLKVSVCPHAGQGMGASLAWGVAQSPGAAGWLIALADMPFIAVPTLQAVAAELHAADAIVAPLHMGRRGHPVAFGAAYGRELARLGGDVGARGVIEAHRDKLIPLPCADPGVLLDIDRPQQLVGSAGEQS